MAHDLQNQGFSVIQINDANDLAQEVIDVTDRSYRGQLR